jgi:hypothetical protein
MVRHSRLSLLACMLLVSYVLSGCENIHDLLGIPRTVPEGDKVSFGNRHAPILNPGGTGVDPTGAATPDVASARRTPAENEASDTPDVTAMSAAVAPVQATNYPALASVPPAPQYPPKAENAAEFNSLTAERELSEAQRQELMNNQNATVMTSPQTGQMVENPAEANAPAPMSSPVYPPAYTAAPQPVSPPAPVPAQVPASPPAGASNSDGGFSAWLNNMFSSDSAKNAPPVKKMPMENAQSTPAVPPPPTPHDLMTQQAVTADYNQMPVDSTNAASAAMPPDTGASQEMEPVHLHPPADMASGSSFTGAEGTADSNVSYGQPVGLRTPMANSPVQGNYLDDSRYAARRAHVPADDDVND